MTDRLQYFKARYERCSVRPSIRLEQSQETREGKDRVATQFELFAGILPNRIGGRTGSRYNYLAYQSVAEAPSLE